MMTITDSGTPLQATKTTENKQNNGDIAIIGAGIAGMVAALALAKYNIPSVIYEKSTILQEVGAGIQLAPNATKLLNDLGLLDAILPYTTEPDSINLNQVNRSKALLSLPIKAYAKQYWHSSYYTIHRADIQKVLKQAIDKNPLIHFISGVELENISGDRQTGFTLHYKDQIHNKTEIEHNSVRKTAKAHYVLCCDGVWSRCRASCGEKVKFSSYIAWRAILPRENLPKAFIEQGALNSVSAYMCKDSHFIIYPLRKATIYNFVVITKGENVGETWSSEGDKNYLMQLFKGHSHLLYNLIKQVPSWTFWPLFQMPFPRFSDESGKIYLGDAAHAVTPFAAQGAAMAIEDACSLAKVLATQYAANNHTQIKAALAQFDIIRQKRLKAVAQRGDFNRYIYHLSGPVAFARNMVMHLRPSKFFITDLNWLYDYDATAAFLPAK